MSSPNLIIADANAEDQPAVENKEAAEAPKESEEDKAEEDKKEEQQVLPSSSLPEAAALQIVPGVKGSQGSDISSEEEIEFPKSKSKWGFFSKIKKFFVGKQSKRHDL